MARDVGFLAPEYTTPCNQLNDDESGIDHICKARILGFSLDTASFRSVVYF